MMVYCKNCRHGLPLLSSGNPDVIRHYDRDPYGKLIYCTIKDVTTNPLVNRKCDYIKEKQ